MVNIATSSAELSRAIVRGGKPNIISCIRYSPKTDFCSSTRSILTSLYPLTVKKYSRNEVQCTTGVTELAAPPCEEAFLNYGNR